jgi:protein kinase-like protein
MSTPDRAFSAASITDTTTQTHIKDPRLLTIARTVWLALVILVVGTFIVAQPAYFNQHLAASPQGDFFFGQLSLEEAQILPQLGLSSSFYATFLVISAAVIVLVSTILGLVIFWRKSEDWMALYVSLTLVIFAVVPSGAMSALVIAQPTWYWPTTAIPVIGTGLLLVLFYLFPDGRFIPRWTKLLAILVAVWMLLATFGFTKANVGDLWFFVLLAFFGPGAAAQIYRYRRVSSPLQRQQTKWVVFGLGTFFVAFLGSLISLLLANLVPSAFQPGLAHFLFRLVNIIFFVNIPLLLLVLSIGFSILRYHLWDVDLVINRSLVYGALTVALGGVFVGGLLVLQAILSAVLGGQQTTAAAVISAVVIVGLFNPTRHRLQHFVDRRFYHLNIGLDQLAAKPAPLANPGVLSGTQIGIYQVLEPIGKGGMGEVYRGVQTSLNRPVAIKILPEHLAKEAEFRARFEREARTVAALKHPNIVSVFDFGQLDDKYYMVMEYIDGQELGDYLKSAARLSLNEARPIVHDIAAALDYAHEQGLVHRDVKASNVMLQKVTETGAHRPYRAILMDFGIAKLVNSVTGLTGTGLMGTLDYVAPEQIMSAREVDGRADIYSLGIVVYQILTGELPFNGDNPARLVFAHLQQPPPDPRDIAPDLPAEAAQAVLKALAKNPKGRFQTAGAFASALDW